MNPNNYVSFVVLLDRDTSKIILVQDSDKEGPEYWKFPGGTWNPKDISPVGTAKREIREEVPQVKFVSNMLLVKKYKKRKPASHKFYLFYAEVEKQTENLQPISKEINKIKEFDFSEIQELAESGRMLKQHAKALDDFVDFVINF